MAPRDDHRLGRSWRKRMFNARATAKKSKDSPVKFPDLTAKKAGVAPLNNGIPGACPKRDKLTEHLWKKGREEKAGAIETAREWSRRAVPLYNKGGVQLASPGDAKFIGKK